MARIPRNILGTMADAQRAAEGLEKLTSAVGSAIETFGKIPKPERGQKLKHAQQFVGGVMLGNFADYPEINKAYLKLKNEGPYELPDGSKISENGFMIGLEAYCGLSDLIIANGGDRAAVYTQCADRLDILEQNLEADDPNKPGQKILSQEQLYEMMDAFQMDLLSDAVRRVKKWVEKTILTKLKELDAGMGRVLQERIQKLEEHLEEHKEEVKARKQWSWLQRRLYYLSFGTYKPQGQQQRKWERLWLSAPIVVDFIAAIWWQPARIASLPLIVFILFILFIARGR